MQIQLFYCKITKNIKNNIFKILNIRFKNSLKFLLDQKTQTCNNENKTKPLTLKNLTKKLN
jgi:hypothetical protein